MVASDPPRLALVLNEKAGRLLAGGDQPAQLRRHLAARGATVHDIPPGPLPARFAQAAASGADAVIVAGGDGTIACACQALAGQKVAMGIVPLGTMNLLARDLGMPVDDLAAAAEILAAGKRRRIDLGRIGEQVFACACMMGAPARIGHHREAARARGHGPAALLALCRATLRSLRKTPPERLTLRIDGQTHMVRTRSLTITVNRLSDDSGRAFGRTVLDGGELHAYVERVRSPWDALRLLTRLIRGSSRDPALLRLGGKRIEVETPHAALRLLIDGEEHLLPPPWRFEIWPGALTVLAT